MSNPQTMPDLFQQTKQMWLDGARITAKKLLRTKHRITIEDVLTEHPLPNYLHRNTIGSVFQNNDFEPVGFTHSQRRVSHGRVIREWSLKEAYATEQDYCE